MKGVAIACVFVFLAAGAWAKDAQQPHFNGSEISGSQSRSSVDVFYECVGLCATPPGWTIVNGGTDPLGYSWDVPYSCGTGLIACPPDDPDEGRSFICPYGSAGEFQDEWLISPAFDASGVATLELSFAHGVIDWIYCTDANYFYLSTDGTNWTPVWSMPCTAVYADFTLYYENADVSAFAGEPVLYLAIQYQGEWAESWWVDEILLTGEEEVTPNAESTWGAIKGLYW